MVSHIKLSANKQSAVLQNEDDTIAFGGLLANACRGAGVIFLNGNLGMGKTTMCRGVLNAMGHQGRVKSPTYTLVEPYELVTGMVYHFDLYRLGDPEELEFMGIRDYLEEQALVIIEWPEKGFGVLPDSDIDVFFELQGTGRLVRWKGNTERGHEIASRLAESLS
ncbi:tRNA (adenosine(37)-N6)-threonylcarbamoyltransferase complex ATPase subunit type 1 TsaE [Alkalimarinus sediminis]|uniref:tRNA threonylcarbamoyladenosine biosynthesis protein TsaE n=1 Tax=Alkalimarinus sediminis TaxID=1632866 RepID=A0A9E8HG88_9ALTE|nr:tRNA (adenosine(37)-N6)-threonylcarbamoyltransferase complex ATPase subunit type 1 TsaE [Alkalimarinus sediminis]UZW74098.1 tRNA (adenosine(37)-N6)-threonylcarbamoyltransferase complex ATPase subunit type 1 TsaE [Alkalimarinus sediminis]